MADAEQPTGTPALRASDAERERTATLLREHTAAGRLTPDELSDRLDAVYAARTVGELDALVADLPPQSPGGAVPPAPAARAPERDRMVHLVGLAVLVCAVCVAVWLATGADGSFWPKWVILASGIRLAFAAWSELGPGSGHPSRHGRGGAQPPELRRGEPSDR